jgi:GT2 family glycosyltransferase
MIQLAILLTCHNRKDKTIKSLSSLLKALEVYNKKNNNRHGLIKSEIYLTDDGCTDGTTAAIEAIFHSEDIHILKGDGNLYWAGGMRFAWKEALKSSKKWDYYLLLNDDTILLENAFDELINTHMYCLNKYNRTGIYSGITCDSVDHSKITYGGDVFINRFTGSRKRLGVSAEPQLCDFTNANIVLLSSEIVNKIGFFYEGYIHGAADFDYTYQARKKGIPVLITAKPCGICDHDHDSEKDCEDKIRSMSLRDRRKFFTHPLHSSADYLTLVRRTQPLKFPITCLFRFLNVYFPSLYYKLNAKR